MDEHELRKLMAQVRAGEVSEDEALRQLRDLPYADLGHAMVDHHRALRQGAAEVVFAQGKDTGHLIAIVRELTGRGTETLITRLDPVQARALKKSFPRTHHNPIGRTARVPAGRKKLRPAERGPVLVVSAGTADAAVVEEARETLGWLGIRAEAMSDCGVAGIHRVLSRRSEFDTARAIIVVAGMEGALASVVAGLTDKPVIGVPTSVGYGAGAGGIAALLGMLNSCGPGVPVMNIDNGFGAAFAAGRILRMLEAG